MPFNHAYSLGFSLVSAAADGSDVTHNMLMEAVLKRLSELSNYPHENLVQACDAPWDSYEMEH